MQQLLTLLLLAGKTGEEGKSFVGFFGMSRGWHCARRVRYSVVDVFVYSVFFIRGWVLSNFFNFCFWGKRNGNCLWSVSSDRRLLSVCDVSLWFFFPLQRGLEELSDWFFSDTMIHEQLPIDLRSLRQSFHLNLRRNRNPWCQHLLDTFNLASYCLLMRYCLFVAAVVELTLKKSILQIVQIGGLRLGKSNPMLLFSSVLLSEPFLCLLQGPSHQLHLISIHPIDIPQHFPLGRTPSLHSLLLSPFWSLLPIAAFVLAPVRINEAHFQNARVYNVCRRTAEWI